jgi:hypothetical protein
MVTPDEGSVRDPSNMLIAEAASKSPVVKDADFEVYDFGSNMLPKRV